MDRPGCDHGFSDIAADRFAALAGGVITTGQFTVVNKKEVVFQDDGVNEQFVGHFDSKTTMSGTFIIASGTKGNWTAKKK